jgi:hypothetical protein
MARRTTRKVKRRSSRRREERQPRGPELTTRRGGRDDGEREERDDELDIFLLRAEWWRQYHGDASGSVSGELRIQAIAHAERLAVNGLYNPDPGGARPAKGFETVVERGAPRIRVSRGENPRPRSSFGFASDPVAVRGPANLAGVVLKIALDAKRAASSDPATIRVFCFEDNSREWQLVPRSGAQAEGRYAWAHLHRPGLYVAIGLHTGAAALISLLMLRALMPRLRAARDEKARQEVLELIEKLFETRAEGDETARRRLNIAGLDISEHGLPEFDLLDELYRPASPPAGKAPGAEIISRLRWDDIHVDLDGLVWFSDWVSVGPRNFSGRIKSLAIHPVEGNGLLAGAADGGVWQTKTGGVTWFPLMSQELSMATGAVARSSSDLSVIYAATGEDTPGWGPSYPGVGVYKSIDGGGTWTLLAPIESNRCTRVLIHPLHVDTVYVAGSGGLHKSTNGGASWTRLRTDHVSDAVMDPTTPDTIYAAVWNNGVFRTTDGGATWSDFSQGLPTGSGADWIKLAASDPAPNGVVTLVAKMGLDSGQLFTRRVHVPIVISPRRRRPPFAPPWTFDPPWQPVPGTHEPASYNEWTDLAAIDPKHPNVLFAGGVGLQRSGDGGATFSQVHGTHSDHHAIVFARLNSDLCYMASDGGVYRSINNGVTWTLCSNGLVATQLYTIGVSQTAGFLLGASTQDQGIIRTNGSADWVDTGAGNEGGIFIVDPNNGNNVYVTPWDGNLRRSTDGGSHWTTILDGITQTGMPPKAATVHDIAVCPTNSNLLLCCAGNEVFRSFDQGNHWSSVFAFSSGSATRVVWYGINTCYATSNAGDVVRSTQQGAANTWSAPYASADKPPYGTITAIEARFVGLVIAQAAAPRAARAKTAVPGPAGFPFHQDLVYIAYNYGGRVYKSRDGGVHWTNASGGGAGALPNIPISALVIDKNFSDTVYVATDIGVFRTRDGGANWEPFNSGLPRVVMTGLVLRRANNTLYASTMGRGAFQRALS